MLKPRSIAKTFYMKEVGNRHHTSFWYDSWSDKGVMFDLLEERGTIDLGIQREATVEEAFHNHRRRKRHIRALLNDIEKELENTKRKQCNTDKDVTLWRRNSGYKPKFTTYET